MRVLICLLLLIQPASGARPKIRYIDWKTTKSWKLYYVHTHGGYRFSLDTLKTIKNISLNEDTIHNFLQTATEIPEDRRPVFMGYYIATCELPDSTTVKIEISQYGAFFREEKEKRYYELAESLQTDWQAYLTAKWRALTGAAL